MSVRRLVFAVAIALSTVVYVGSKSSAQSPQERLPDGTVVEFILPTESAFTPAADTSLVFTGPEDGHAYAAPCLGEAALQSAIVITPGQRSSSANTLVARTGGLVTVAVPPGTRLRQIVRTTACHEGIGHVGYQRIDRYLQAQRSRHIRA